MSFNRVACTVLVVVLAMACDDTVEPQTLQTLRNIRGHLVVLEAENASDITVNLLGAGVARSVRTSPDGSFSFDGVPAGIYSLTPAATYLEPETSNVDAFRADVDLGDVKRQAFGEVTGTVVLPAGIDPARAAVTVEGSKWVARVDATGHYTLPWVPAGDDVLLAVAPDCLPAKVSVSFHRAEKITAPDLVLQPGTLEERTTLSGTVGVPQGSVATSLGSVVTLQGTELSDTVDDQSDFAIIDAPLGFSTLIVHGFFLSGEFEAVLFPETEGFLLKTVTRQNDIVARRLASLVLLPADVLPPVAPEDSNLMLLPSEQGEMGLFRTPSSQADLTLFSLDAMNPKEVLVSETRGRQFQFTPDGTSLFYEVPPEDHVSFSLLKRLPVDAGTPIALANDMMEGTPFLLSPDGTRVVYVACCEGSAVVLRALHLSDSSTTTLRELDQADQNSWSNNALFTSDSQRLLFISMSQLVVATFDGTTPMVLADLASDSTFQLTHDEKHVIYARGRPGPLFSADLAGESEPIALTGSGIVLALSDDDAQALVMSPGHELSFVPLGATAIDRGAYVCTATLLPDGESVVWMEDGMLRASSLPKAAASVGTFCVQPVPTLAFAPSHGRQGDPIVFPLPRTFEREVLQLTSVDFNGRQELFNRTAESRLCFKYSGHSAQLYRRGEITPAVEFSLVQATACPYIPSHTLLYQRPGKTPRSPGDDAWVGGYFTLPLE